jgi:hypothetical protein
MKEKILQSLHLERMLAMQQNCVMNDYHDSISSIEDYLNLNNIEYQAHGNQIEIYLLEKNQVRVVFSGTDILLICQKKEYFFDKISNDFFMQLKKLID